jgi:hypothetical protein
MPFGLTEEPTIILAVALELHMYLTNSPATNMISCIHEHVSLLPIWNEGKRGHCGLERDPAFFIGNSPDSRLIQAIFRSATMLWTNEG